MLILVKDQSIAVTWNPKNRKHYENLGYQFSGYRSTLHVKAEDLMENSNAIVSAICDYCNCIVHCKYQVYKRAVNKHGTYSCQNCIGQKVNSLSIDCRRYIHYQTALQFCKNNNYVLKTTADEIKNNQSIIHYICPEHGDVYAKMISIVQGKRCYACSRINAGIGCARTKLHNNIENRKQKVLYIAKERGYQIKSDLNAISTNAELITYICPTHGEFSMRAYNFINGRGCPKCAIQQRSEYYRLTVNDVKERVRLCGGVIMNPCDYINQYEKNLHFICNRCGMLFASSLSNYCQHDGQLCSVCSRIESNGERKIREYLSRNHIAFEQEKCFSDCADIRPLPFDFYLPDQHICIEYDGEQHYREKTGFRNTLEYTFSHDCMKTAYCMLKDIELIRVPYYNIQNIDSILNNYLHKDIV